jgi:trimethylamine--corrinoid protein Co-methyltransferase
VENGLQHVGIYNALSGEGVECIHRGSLEVLQTSGVIISNEEARTLLADNGALVVKGSNKVKFPPKMVEAAIASSPKSLTLYRRDTDERVIIAENSASFSTWGGCVNLVDMRTGNKRPFTESDHREAAIIVDALPEIAVYKTPGCMKGVGEEVQQIRITETALHSTGKPLYMAAGSKIQLKIIADMLFAASGGHERFRQKPSLVISACPQSPLSMSSHTCHVIMVCARIGVPLSITSMVMAGASGPVRLSGTLVVGNAEFLAGLVLHQLSGTGSAVLYGSVSTAMDLRYGNAPIGTPEIALLSSAASQMAKRYGVPANVHGGCDSKTSDAQSAHEMTLTALLPALAGGGLITAAGVLDMGLTSCFRQLVRDCEFIRMIRYVLDGMQLDDESLALDVIKEIGPLGTYLTHESTAKLVRTSHSVPGLINRQSSPDWERSGAKTIDDRAYTKAVEILNNHNPCGLREDVATLVREIAAQGEKEILGIKSCTTIL